MLKLFFSQFETLTTIFRGVESVILRLLANGKKRCQVHGCHVDLRFLVVSRRVFVVDEISKASLRFVGIRVIADAIAPTVARF